jgi:hypothetical protein
MMMRAQKKSANIKVISSPISGKFVSNCVMTARNFAYVHHFFILRKITYAKDRPLKYARGGVQVEYPNLDRIKRNNESSD